MRFFRKKNKDTAPAPAAVEAGPADQQLQEALQKLEAILRAWQPKIIEIASGLTGVSADTEAEFVSIGAELQTFSKGCAASSEGASAIAAMMEGGSGFNIEALKELFEHAHDKVESCAISLSGGISGMKDLMQRIDSILELRLFLKKLAHSISVLGTLMKIETARVGEDEFNIMTSIVDDLSREIEDGSDEIVAAAGIAGSSLSGSSARISAVLDKFNRELSANKEHIITILNEMDRMIMQSKWVCKRLGDRAAQISPEVGNVVTALQYHDICRQQMEHVSDVLKDIASGISSMGGSDTAEQASFSRWTAHAITIQISQLEHVIAETASSAENISSHLSRISDIAGAQTEDVSLLLEEGDTEDNRIAKIGSELKSLSGMLSESKEMAISLGTAVADIAEAISGMSRQVSNIEMISENINLLALNTIIKVARTGETGRGLEVLAGEIRKLSVNAKNEITKGSEVITGILTTSSEFKRTVSDELEREIAATDEIFLRTNNTVQELLETDARVKGALDEISAKTKALEADVMRLISDIKFDATIKTGLEGMVISLRSLLKELEENMSGLPEAGTARQDINHLENRYTMHSEREVHIAALGTGSKKENGNNGKGNGNGNGSSGAYAAAVDNSLGDNVELF